MDCFFCDRQEDILLENSLFFSRLDEFPISPGHTLIAPKAHVPSFFDCADVSSLFSLIQETYALLQERYKPDGFTIGINEGRAAGRTVDHFHIHIIPRYTGDVENPIGGVRNIFPFAGDYLKCDFCVELKKGFFNFSGEQFNRVLYETENFAVIPSLGHIVPGYLLIIPKRHYISLGAIPSKEYTELEEVQAKVRSVLEQEYGKVLFFEHGPTSITRRGGCCIDHAHLHAIPFSGSILSEVGDWYRQIESYTDVKKQFETGVPYFFVEEKARFLFPAIDTPSQYLRRLVAAQVDKPWDWAVYLGMEEMKETFNRLKDKFGETNI